MSDFLRPLLTLLLLVLPAVAELPTAQTRTVRILFLNAPADAPRTIHLHGGTTSQEVELPRMNLSKSYALPAGSLTLRLLAEPVEKPELIPVDAPTVLIPETIGDAYLLCSPDPANPVVPIQMRVVDADKEKFSTGQMLWLNQTSHEISGKLGDKEVLIKPMESAIVDSPTREPDSYAVVISYRIKDGEDFLPITETRWMHDPRSRQLVFIFNEDGKRLPRIQSFADFPVPPSVP